MEGRRILVGAIVLLLTYVINGVLIRPLHNLLKSRRHGCGPVPFEPTRWPLGIDLVIRGLWADKDQSTPDFVTMRFESMGRYTWGLSLLGTSNLVTAEPRNVQAILATQFEDFVMGTARRTNLKTVLEASLRWMVRLGIAPGRPCGLCLPEKASLNSNYSRSMYNLCSRLSRPRNRDCWLTIRAGHGQRQ